MPPWLGGTPFVIQRLDNMLILSCNQCTALACSSKLRRSGWKEKSILGKKSTLFQGLGKVFLNSRKSIYKKDYGKTQSIKFKTTCNDCTVFKAHKICHWRQRKLFSRLWETDKITGVCCPRVMKHLNFFLLNLLCLKSLKKDAVEELNDNLKSMIDVSKEDK